MIVSGIPYALQPLPYTFPADAIVCLAKIYKQLADLSVKLPPFLQKKLFYGEYLLLVSWVGTCISGLLNFPLAYRDGYAST